MQTCGKLFEGRMQGEWPRFGYHACTPPECGKWRGIANKVRLPWAWPGRSSSNSRAIERNPLRSGGYPRTSGRSFAVHCANRGRGVAQIQQPARAGCCSSCNYVFKSKGAIFRNGLVACGLTVGHPNPMAIHIALTRHSRHHATNPNWSCRFGRGQRVDHPPRVLPAHPDP